MQHLNFSIIPVIKMTQLTLYNENLTASMNIASSGYVAATVSSPGVMQQVLNSQTEKSRERRRE
ncbi:hypothetical protein [Serratia sp. 2723]|uniref:hypothetical protein n=1 Tax=unclassified Serratia (in: enterobacteria) TaxID=2647522 RepID=UPI003D22D563